MNISYLEHFKVTDKLVTGGEVVPEHDDAPAGLAADVTEAVVGEVGDPGAGADIHTTVRAQPSLGTETHTWRKETRVDLKICRQDETQQVNSGVNQRKQ